jgi:hypothetical protein
MACYGDSFTFFLSPYKLHSIIYLWDDGRLVVIPDTNSMKGLVFSLITSDTKAKFSIVACMKSSDKAAESVLSCTRKCWEAKTGATIRCSARDSSAGID